MAPTQFKSDSMGVKVEGKAVTRMADPHLHNVAFNSRAVQLRSRLQTITSQLVGMPAGNPDHWHQLVAEYVLVSAELYLEMTK
jgi:hypothetical protein